MALTVTPRGQGRSEDTQGSSSLETSGTASKLGICSLETEGSWTLTGPADIHSSQDARTTKIKRGSKLGEVGRLGQMPYLIRVFKG